MYDIKFWTGRGSGLTTAELGELYRIGAADGTLGLVAYDCPRLTPQLFETFVRRLGRIGFFAGVYGEAGKSLGFFFLSGFEGDTARLHFCLFRSAAGERHAVGRRVLSAAFSLFKLKTIIGLVPAINQGAARFCLEMGGAKSALIPGACWMARLRRSAGGLQFLFHAENFREEHSWVDSTSW